jgi:hypothetical protein
LGDRALPVVFWIIHVEIDRARVRVSAVKTAMVGKVIHGSNNGVPCRANPALTVRSS